ncbi:MAG TPA: hypothetical protein VGF04_03300 [Solirubrobacterales bacterium]
MRKLKRRLTTFALCVVGAIFLLPTAAQAATTFGDPLTNEPSEVKCLPLGPCSIVSFESPTPPEGNPNSEGAPFDGVITRFRYWAYAYEEPGQITFRVANITRQDPDNALATSAGSGPTVTIQPTEEETAISEVAARLPVKKGQKLAVDITKSIAIVYNPDGCNYSYVYAPPLEEGAGQRASTESACRLDVAAIVEPDADGDGFGDETQDQCPTQASTQGPCDNTKPGVSGFKVKGSKISYKLSEPATISFKLERKSPGRKVGGKCVKQKPSNKKKKKCPRFKKVGAKFSGPGKQGANTAPLPNGKKLKPGTYRLTITATDAAGNTTTKTTTFKVKKKKKKRKG